MATEPSPVQLRVARKAGCVIDGRIIAPHELPATLLETLKLVCQGYQNIEIADMRHYSLSGITRHVTALLVVFKARNRTHLATLAAGMDIE